MPATLTFDARGFFVLTISDPATPEDPLQALTALGQQQEHRPGMPLLIDRRAAAPPTTAYVSTVTTILRPVLAELGVQRLAMLVADRASFGMARMGQALLDDHDGLTVCVFTDYQDACRWVTSPPARSF